MKTSHLQSMQAFNKQNITKCHEQVSGSKLLLKDLKKQDGREQDEDNTVHMLIDIIKRAKKRIKKLVKIQVAIKKDLRHQG